MLLATGVNIYGILCLAFDVEGWDTLIMTSIVLMVISFLSSMLSKYMGDKVKLNIVNRYIEDTYEDSVENIKIKLNSENMAKLTWIESKKEEIIIISTDKEGFFITPIPKSIEAKGSHYNLDGITSRTAKVTFSLVDSKHKVDFEDSKENEDTKKEEV